MAEQFNSSLLDNPGIEGLTEVSEAKKTRKKEPSTQYELNDRDRYELLTKRGMLEDWARCNARSATAKEGAEYLYRQSVPYGGIILEGANFHGQYRPCKQFKSKSSDKKASKYLSRSKEEYDAMLPWKPDDRFYWDNLDDVKIDAINAIKINNKPFIIITEGLIKAIFLMMFGYPAIALKGVEMGLTSSCKGKVSRELVPEIERLVKAGFGFILAFDADIAYKIGVQRALYKLGKKLKQREAEVLMASWDEKDGKGVDDLIHRHGIEAFREVLENLIKFDDWASDFKNAEQESKAEPKSKLMRLATRIEEQWGKRIKFNAKKKIVELDGEELNMEYAQLHIARHFDVDVGKNTAIDLIMNLAEERQYDPFKVYLDSLPVLPQDPWAIVGNLAEKYFGNTDPLAQMMMARTLIAAVARTYQPGCKHDTVCILQGAQGCKKSTFWSELAGAEHFTDDLSGTAKDEIMKLSRYLIIEIGEFETAYKKKDVAGLKKFLSRSTDSIRIPYAKGNREYPRPSIFVGSTNKNEFLYDPTGERRYWVIKVFKDRRNQIDIDLLKSERDLIWSAAKSLYKSGEQWWLTDSEAELLGNSNKDYSASDAWEEPIMEYLRNKEVTSVRFILDECLKVDTAHQDRKAQMRVAEILMRLGWEKGGKRIIKSKRVNSWVLPKNKQVGHLDFGGVGQEEGHPSNSVAVSNTATSVQPTQPFINNLDSNESMLLANNSSLNTNEVFKKGQSPSDNLAVSPTPQGIEECPTSECPTFENPPTANQFKKNEIVYPTTGKYEGKQCKVSTADCNGIWVYPITNQLGVVAVAYQMEDLSYEAPQATEEPESTYSQPSFWDDEEYLKPADD